MCIYWFELVSQVSDVAHGPLVRCTNKNDFANASHEMKYVWKGGLKKNTNQLIVADNIAISLPRIQNATYCVHFTAKKYFPEYIFYVNV